MITPANHYRRLASSLRTQALYEESVHLAAEWDDLAECYDRLAGQADKSGRTDLADNPNLQFLDN